MTRGRNPDIEPDFTASLRRGAPALEVVAEERIPEDYWKPQPPKLDRQALLAALRGGSEIEGVALGAPQVQLSVRTTSGGLQSISAGSCSLS